MTTEQQLIKAQKEYIEFLGAEVSRLSAFFIAYPHMQCSEEVITEGARRRSEIIKLESELKWNTMCDCFCHDSEGVRHIAPCCAFTYVQRKDHKPD